MAATKTEDFEPVERITLSAAAYNRDLAEVLSLQPGDSVGMGDEGIHVRRADGTTRLIATVPREMYEALARVCQGATIADLIDPADIVARAGAAVRALPT
jgi:hypothetical protein